MKQINTSSIGPGIGFPVKKGSLEFLQLSYRELFAELLQELSPNLTIEDYPLAMRGATFVNVSNVYTLQPGAIFIPGAILGTSIGELFILPNIQTVATTGAPDYPILTLDTTYYTGDGIDADPVKFTDGITRNVHAMRTLTLTHGDSSSPNFICYLDYNNPATPPNTTANLLYNTPNVNLKHVEYRAGVDHNVSNSDTSGTPQTFISPFTVSSNLRSLQMTVTLNCNLGFPDTWGYLYLAIRQNGTVIRDANIGLVNQNVAPLDVPVTLITVVTYNPGDTFDVIGRGYGTGNDAAIEQLYLICECNDGAYTS